MCSLVVSVSRSAGAAKASGPWGALHPKRHRRNYSIFYICRPEARVHMAPALLVPKVVIWMHTVYSDAASLCTLRDSKQAIGVGPFILRLWRRLWR